MINIQHLRSYRKKLLLSLAGPEERRKENKTPKAAFFTMTLQNPSTVQTIHFTQLTLLYRQLLSEIETGYYWTV